MVINVCHEHMATTKLICPKCHQEIEVELALARLKCKRCSHEWVRRGEELPEICPECKSPYWNRVRKRTLRVTE